MHDLDGFKEKIWKFYREYRRDFPWREDITPYRIFVSEIMLQQTQVHRVVPKFEYFIARFPDFSSLAHAPFADVLSSWKGLGYNRRAMALKNAAVIIVDSYDGILPREAELLVNLPGIGKATAASISAFAFNRPTVFIETNIRTVFIDAFFKERTEIHDREILSLVEATLDQASPRDWYYALMDYGAMLKKTVGNLSTKSIHYHRQSRFEGSDRQIRGKILAALLLEPRIATSKLSTVIGDDPDRTLRILESLVREKMVLHDDDQSEYVTLSH